jgi:hypothetical protein
VAEKYWNNTEENFDRMRKKQAEFLVKDYVPVNCISCIVVYDKDNKLFVEKIVSKLDLEIPVLINPDSKYYY